MAITFDRLKELLKGENLKFYIDPERGVARLMFQALFGRHEVVASLQDEGRFLQLRTINYGSCPADHAHRDAVLRVLAHVNYRRRLVKFGWDPSDGEIVGYADLWIMDGEVTQQQFSRMMSNFVPSIDQTHARIQATLETGKDPGDEGVMKSLAEGGGPAPIPPELKKALEEMQKRPGDGGGGGKKSGDGESVTEI